MHVSKKTHNFNVVQCFSFTCAYQLLVRSEPDTAGKMSTPGPLWLLPSIDPSPAGEPLTWASQWQPKLLKFHKSTNNRNSFEAVRSQQVAMCPACRRRTRKHFASFSKPGQVCNKGRETTDTALSCAFGHDLDGFITAPIICNFEHFFCLQWSQNGAEVL